MTEVERFSLVIEIGGMPVRVHTTDSDFLSLLESRYTGFVSDSDKAEIDFDVELQQPTIVDPDVDVEVSYHLGRWTLRRGDFLAEWEAAARRGWIRQTANPYSIDAVLRIVHTLVLAKHGGFLLHSASAIRDGRAFLFAGVSGAGKTTMTRLAPADATLLTDEISYVRPGGSGYFGYGTPFVGELAKPGKNCSAPIRGLFFLEKGHENRIEMLSPSESVRRLMQNILFFAQD